PSYLWEPVPGDPGAHGDFDSEAHASSPQYTLTTHRPLVAGLVGGAAAASLARRSRSRR
ncbi:MAG: hypothetical protein QOD63_1023, partial [Actinomycetota bacterium]|nr:hypothetical protein [Actinomycetota bacterium]